MRIPHILAGAMATVVVAPCLLLTSAAADQSDLAQLAEQAAQGDTTTLAGPTAARRAERRAERNAADATPGSRGAAPIKAGWWWLVNEPPEEAETGLLAIPAPPTPTVPGGTLPVSAVAGDAEKVSALEIGLSEPDRAVQRLVLGLQEAEDPQANPGADMAVVLACQVTEAFWADGQAARWRSRPAYDCEQGAAQGVRDETGRWTFDLTPLARSWTGEDALSSSVVLVEAAEAPGSFQVAFQGIGSDTIGLTAVFGDSVLPPEDDEQPDPEVVEEAGTPPSGSGGSVSSGSGGMDGGSGGDLGSAPGAGSDPVAAGTSGDGGVSEPGFETRAVTIPSWYDGIPAGGLMLVPIALLTAFLAMLALGPDGQPVPGRPMRGVSLALERLRGSRPPARPGA